MPRLLGALAFATLVAVGCSDDEPADYDAEFRADFLARCEDAYDHPGGPQVCGCWYDSLSGEVAFGDLPDLGDLLADDFDDAPTRVPGGDLDVPLAALATCVRDLAAVATIDPPAPPPTAPREPPPPTTTTTVVA
jgi:hypothetical protein